MAKSSGCIVGLFKFVGGIIGLMVAVSFLSGGEKSDPFKELESRCQELSDSYSIESEKPTVYSSCVISGKAALRAHGVE